MTDDPIDQDDEQAEPAPPTDDEPDAEPDVRNDPIPLQPGDPAPEDDPAAPFTEDPT